MADLSVLEVLVRPFVKACPAILIEHQLRQAARDFCKLTEKWLVETSGVPVSAGEFRVVIPIAQGQDIVTVTKVKFPGRREPLVPVDDQEKLPITSAEIPQCYTAVESEAILIGPIPNANITLNVTVAVMPSVGISEVHKDLTTRWGEAISYKAISELLNEEGYDWFSPNMAEIYKRKYIEAVRDARSNKATGNVHSQNVATSPGFM